MLKIKDNVDLKDLQIEKLNNVPKACLLCSSPVFDYYNKGTCKKCCHYNGTQDILWDKKIKDKEKK